MSFLFYVWPKRDRATDGQKRLRNTVRAGKTE